MGCMAKQRRGRLTEHKFLEVHSSCVSATKPSHGHVKAPDFFVFSLQASISGAAELCVRFTFTAMILYVQRSRSLLLVSK